MKRKIDTSAAVKIKKKKKETKILTAEERQRRKTSLYRAPTCEEINELKENENLYKNNLFRMQIQYLLEEVTLNEEKTKKLNNVLHSLNEFLKSIPSSPEECGVSGSCLPTDVRFPIPDTIARSKIKGKFQFIAPQEIKVVGSYLLKTLTKPNQFVDIAVEMPKECLQAKDYLNYRYHFKRACYLSWLASALKKWEHNAGLMFSSDEDVYKPIIKIKLKGKIGKKYSIRLLISVPEDIFKLSRFNPLQNNVRSNWYDNLDSEATEELEYPTPHYNASILSDMLYETHLHTLYNAVKECPGIKDAICLFKVWLKQRTFKGVCTFNGFIGSMLMVYLLQARKISSHMSSYQIFRIVLHFLGTSDWIKNGISLCTDENHKCKVGDFHALTDVVFVDPSGFLNLCFNVNKVTYEMIKYQAQLSLDILDNSMIDGFNALFIKYYSFMQSVDHSFRLSHLNSFKEKLLNEETYKSKIVDFGGDWSLLIAEMVVPVLQKGLGKRINRITMKPSNCCEWTVTTNPPGLSNRNFEFGIYLNNEFSDNIIDMGPPADQPEAKEFRDFWGAKSELRRFQDGSINEAAIWPCVNIEEKKMICKRIVEHLLKLHCNITSLSIKYHGDEFNCLLKPKYVVEEMKSKVKPGCGEEEFVNFIKTYDALCKQIRNLDELPLRINSIHAIDPAFRMTAVVPPSQCKTKPDIQRKFLLPRSGKKCPTWCPVYNTLIQFETSGKWPDDIEAIHHIKAAFHIKIANCLQRVGIPAVSTPTFVDVTKNGYVFRFSVVHYREMVLCTESSATGLLKKQHEITSKELDVLIVKKPVHNTLIHSLNGQHNAYALTTRLSKRWIASQMLSDYFCDEAIELIVASMFLSPAPLEAPSSHYNGFLRFLNFLTKFDWQNEPLIVNLNDQLTIEDVGEVQERFGATRSQLPPAVIATPYDKEMSVWTKINPSKQILRRVSLLAAAALKLTEADNYNWCGETVKQMFRPSLEDYHYIIELNKDFVPLYSQAIDSSILVKPTAVKDTISNSCIPVVDFDPVKLYLKELREAFSEVAMFFYDAYGGTKVGVVWKPSANTPQPFKILHAQYKMLVKKKKSRKKDVLSNTDTMVANIPAILSDFKVIGKGLVVAVKENS